MLGQRVAIAIAVLFVGCSTSGYSSKVSPSGDYRASIDITTGLLKLDVVVIATGKKLSFQTRASDYQKWALDWSPKNTIVLYSSDIGTYAYDIKDGAIVERSADPDEMATGRNAYEKKYGRKPL